MTRFAGPVAATPPSLLLEALRLAHRKGLPMRGSARLLDRLPSRIWGGEVVTVDTHAGPMTLPLRDHGPRQLLLFGEVATERQETALLRALSPRLCNVLDIGANVGWYSCLLAHTGLRPGGRIVAVDPNPAVRDYLATNAARHPQIEILNHAVSDTVGETSFYSAPSSDLSSASRCVGDETVVPCTTVDEIVAARFTSVDLVKCDVEGGEPAVLRGARGVRASEDPPIWLLEAWEPFLIDANSGYDDLDDELASVGESVVKFALDDAGRWAELDRFADLRGRSRVNVALVPSSRMPLVQPLLPVG